MALDPKKEKQKQKEINFHNLKQSESVGRVEGLLKFAKSQPEFSKKDLLKIIEDCLKALNDYSRAQNKIVQILTTKK